MRHAAGWLAAAVVMAVACGPVATASAQCRPATGCERAELAAVDAAMIAFMCEHDIPGGVLSIARAGDVVFERGYGWMDEARTRTMRPDAMMRIASVSKPITLAGVRKLIADGRFTLDSFVFDLGQPGGGLLPAAPFPSLGDSRLASIRIRHLINHSGGWDRDTAGDHTYREIQIAAAMGVDSPPGRENTVRWILGRPLQFDPGSREAYSNIGCLVMGLIVERYAEQGLMEFLQERVLTPAGIADEDHELGRTFAADRNPREPWYQPPRTARNVFDPAGPWVPSPYGAWHHEARIGQGGQITTARALARFAAHYWVNGANIGASKSPAQTGSWRWNHTGALEGTSSLIRQRGDGITYGVIFNKGSSYGGLIREALDPVLDAVETWPGGEPACCPGDLSGDGLVDFSDYLEFLNRYETGDLRIDFSQDGLVDFADYLEFMNLYEAGC